VLYPQNGDRIVTIDSVTSVHPMYSAISRNLEALEPGSVLVSRERRESPGKRGMALA